MRRDVKRWGHITPPSSTDCDRLFCTASLQHLSWSSFTDSLCRELRLVSGVAVDKSYKTHNWESLCLIVKIAPILDWPLHTLMWHHQHCVVATQRRKWWADKKSLLCIYVMYWYQLPTPGQRGDVRCQQWGPNLSCYCIYANLSPAPTLAVLQPPVHRSCAELFSDLISPAHPSLLWPRRSDW